MDNEIRWWFTGFEEGLAALPEEERGTLLHSCAKNCLEMGMLDFYRGVQERSGGDIDAFFRALGEMGSLGTEIVRPGKEFWLIFRQCTCSLHTQGYINSSLLCECSRQSVMHILRELWPDRRFSVDPVGTILNGAQDCRFHIIEQEEPEVGAEI